MRKSLCCASGLLLILLLGACGSRLDTSPSAQQFAPSQPIISDAAHIQTRSTPAVHGSSTPQPMIPSLLATPTPAAPSTPRGRGSGTAAAPYGPPPPLSGEETQLTQQLFALINHDRAVRGLYPFRWNNILASGARLHSWNMRHCGFSHTCPDGRDQCTRIAAEGFAGFTDCGECIGLAGPYPTAWGGVRAVQESMINEPPTGWHRIHLTSTTLHSVGVGLVVDARGWLWFTEDMVSQS